jgi:hypothetical protein
LELIQSEGANFRPKPFSTVTESFCDSGAISFFPWASKQTDDLHFTLPSEKAADLFLCGRRIPAKGFLVNERAI